MVIDISEESDLRDAARKVLNFAGDQCIWLLQGEVGAGKTTFIRAVCTELGAVDEVSSPTFSLINEYQTAKGGTIYHFDFYRIQSENEAENLGLEEYFYSDNLCLIEWPEKIPHLIPDRYLKINIKFVVEKRTIHLTNHGPDKGD